MQYLKQRILETRNTYSSIKNKNFVSIKSTNSFHTFKISFIISHSNSIQKKILSIEQQKNRSPDKLLIQAELMGSDESIFSENNKRNEIPEIYNEIYTLAELKNIIKGFEWFISLEEFKQAFLKGINNDNYELFINKNGLILSILIVNIFGEEYKSILFLKPINKNINNIKEEVNFNQINNLNINTLSFDYKLNKNKNNDDKTKKITSNKSISIIINNKKDINREFLDKKRFRTNENRINEFHNQENLKNGFDKENQKNIYNIIDHFLKDLDNSLNYTMPEFKINGIAKESKIIKNTKEESIIGNNLSISKHIKYRLLYRATRDGDSSKIFHLKCDNFHNLAVIIETREGKRFGGYTSSKFKGANPMKIDNKAFLFSLDLKKIYNITPDQYAIDCNPKSGPSFSGGSLFIPDNFFAKFGKTCAAGGPYKFEKDYELNNGKKNFIVKELEIFQIKIEVL